MLHDKCKYSIFHLNFHDDFCCYFDPECLYHSQPRRQQYQCDDQSEEWQSILLQTTCWRNLLKPTLIFTRSFYNLGCSSFYSSRYWSGSVLKPSNWFKMMCLHNTFHLKQFILLHNTEYFIFIKINSQLNYSELKHYNNNSHNHRNAVITNLSLHNSH